MRILVVDDEAEIREVVGAYLMKRGYQVLTASDGREALHLIQQSNPDLVVLDLMLPKLNGWEVASRVREQFNTPIIMLTARNAEEERIEGLQIGADDYVVKPFSPRELVARVDAVLRRTQDDALDARLTVGDLDFDLDACEVYQAGQLLDTTPMEFKLLATLARHPHQVFTRLQLLEAAQSMPVEALERTVDSHIKNLRKKLENRCKAQHIKTVYGFGYRFEPQAPCPPST